MVSTKSLRRGLGLLLLFWVALTSVFAQKDSVKTRHPAVQLKARAQKDRILLRWAVDQPGAWHRANQYGFHIERFTVMRDGKTVSKIPRTVLTPQPIRPKGQQEWLQVMETNDRAAILAQCLFGESPEVSTPKDPIQTMMDKAELLNQRFAFALMAADQSFEAALLAGWGYVDTDVKPNERYFYTVKTTMPASVLPVTGGKEYVGLPDYTELPALPEIQVEFGDKGTQLQWYTRSLTAFYNWNGHKYHINNFLPLYGTLNTSIDQVLPYVRCKDEGEIGREDLIPFAIDFSGRCYYVSIGQADYKKVYVENTEYRLLKIANLFEVFINGMERDVELDEERYQ